MWGAGGPLGGDECLGDQPANPDMGLAWIAMIASLDTSFGLLKVTVADTRHICLAKARTFTPDRKPSGVSPADMDKVIQSAIEGGPTAQAGQLGNHIASSA